MEKRLNEIAAELAKMAKECSSSRRLDTKYAGKMLEDLSVRVADIASGFYLPELPPDDAV